MKICILTDKVGTAIHEPELAKAKILDRHQITVCDVHPKRPSPEQLDRFYNAAINADVIDYQYWKSASLVRDLYPELKQKKSLLTHHNPYDVTNPDAHNEEYEMVFTTNRTMAREIEKSGVRAKCIPHGIDLDLFEYTGEMVSEPIFQMAVNRIEGKKGVLEVAEACRDLGYRLLLVGRVSDPNYFNKVLSTGAVEFRENLSWEDLRKSYHQAMAHICNSVDGFESGTLPMLEAMASGIPVITRNIGQVPDMYEKNNPCCLINEGEPSDVGKYMKKLVEDRSLRCSLAKRGLETVRQFSNRRRAFRYNKYYHRKNFEDYTTPLVSVIIPAYRNLDTLGKLIGSVEKQDYPNVEIIVVEDDVSDQETEIELLVKELKPMLKKAITYYRTNYDGYGLAMARNIGAVNSYGEVLLFCDQRFRLRDVDFISIVVHNLRQKMVVYPAKEIGGSISPKTDFVENISAIKKSDFIIAGMFNERITEYGGMSQEYRYRLRNQEIQFNRLSTIVATESTKSPDRVQKQKGIRRMKDMLFILGVK